MNNKTYTIELITPCFIVGALNNANSPANAELRAPSIRGELRWWFRVLGGSQTAEHHLFGGVHGLTEASRIITRVSINPSQERHADLPPDCLRPNSALSYVFHFFAKESGKTPGTNSGPRVQREAFYSPGTLFNLTVVERLPLSDQERRGFDQAMQCFLRIGSLGLRATRGCGALSWQNEVLTADAFKKWALNVPNTVAIRLANNQVYPDWKDCLSALASFLKNFRKENALPAKRPSSLGTSDPRHRSCLHLRPVKVVEGVLPILFYSDQSGTQPSLSALVLDKTYPLFN
jgi:CRISPR-associated protein Cmr1